MLIQHLPETGVEIATAHFGGVHVVAASGELDLHTSTVLRDELERVLDDGATRVIVDLLATSFVDSATLGLLALTDELLRAAGGRLIIAVDNPPLRVFEVTGLDRVLALERSLGAAVDAATRTAESLSPR